MGKLIDEFRKGWQGEAVPSLGLSIAFAVACLLVATLARWGLAHVRPDVYFTPYFPAVFFAAAFGGLRIGVVTALVGGVLGVVVNFDHSLADRARFATSCLKPVSRRPPPSRGCAIHGRDRHASRQRDRRS